MRRDRLPSQAVTPQWIYRLVQPVLELGFDLVAPRYTRHKMEGLLNRSILSPLHRALYGEQLKIRWAPISGSRESFCSGFWGRIPAVRRSNGNDLVASIAPPPRAAASRFANRIWASRTQPPTDWMNLSSLLAEVLGPVFLEMERQARILAANSGIASPCRDSVRPDAAAERYRNRGRAAT